MKQQGRDDPSGILAMAEMNLRAQAEKREKRLASFNKVGRDGLRKLFDKTAKEADEQTCADLLDMLKRFRKGERPGFPY